MGDSLRLRAKFAVVAPSTNTSVQPEYDAMRPRGVTNRFARISIITPCTPVGDNQARRLFEDPGHEALAIKGLKCAIEEVGDPEVDATIQCDTNLAFARVAGIAEFWPDKPVIAINTATCWRALRSHGIMDQIDGFGALLADY